MWAGGRAEEWKQEGKERAVWSGGSMCGDGRDEQRNEEGSSQVHQEEHGRTLNDDRRSNDDADADDEIADVNAER